ncbi:MAG: Sun protein, partial [Myxococcales bacterium]|nr:Sun protein [Myxococcales bacterium]
AADLHPNKLARLAEEPAGRPKPRHTFAVDWTRGRGGATGPYDRILVDAPCSGVGTLRRRPEILGRLQKADVTRLADLQRRIVTQVAPLLRVEGRLVYAVCSVLEAEAEEVIAALTAGPLEGGVELASVPFDGAFARGVAGEATSLRLLPGRHGTDGYFVASLKRVR